MLERGFAAILPDDYQQSPCHDNAMTNYRQYIYPRYAFREQSQWLCPGMEVYRPVVRKSHEATGPLCQSVIDRAVVDVRRQKKTKATTMQKKTKFLFRR